MIFWWHSCSPAASGSPVIWKHCRSDYTVSHEVISNSYLESPLQNQWMKKIDWGQKDDWLRCKNLPKSVLMVESSSNIRCYILLWRWFISQHPPAAWLTGERRMRKASVIKNRKAFGIFRLYICFAFISHISTNHPC